MSKYRQKPKSDKQRMELLGSIAQMELERAEGSYSDELQRNREMALKYYKGTEPGVPSDENGKAIEGRSQIVSKDVADTTNAILAMMREMLILDAELVIEADGEQDEIMAKAESDICTDVLMKDNNGHRVLLTAIKDALLLKNGCTKVISEPRGDGTYACRVFACPIENISYSPGWEGPMQEVPFFAERVQYTRSDLVELGIPRSVVNTLQHKSDADTAVKRERDVTYDYNRDGQTPDTDRIDCHECYILTDMDGDGISERYRALVADRYNCIQFEQVPMVPYAMGSPFMSPHRLTGESVFDRIRHIQDSNTTALRQWHDNVAANNNGRYIYDPSQVDEGDIFTPMAGGGIRARSPDAVVPLVVPDMTTGIAMLIEHNKNNRTEAVGAALDMASAEAQLTNKAATVASIEKGNQELVSSMVADNLAQSIILGTFRLIHIHLRMYSDRPYIARINGQAVPVDPTQWRMRKRMMVRCGMSPSQKANMSQALMQHQQLQAQAMMNGLDGVLADENTLYRTQLRLLRMAGVQDPESITLDPQSQKALQAREAKQQQAQQQMQAMQAQEDRAAQLEQAKLAEDARQKDAEIAHKYYDTDMEAQIAETKIAGQGVIDLEKQRMTNEAAAQSGAQGGNTGTGGAAE